MIYVAKFNPCAITAAIVKAEATAKNSTVTAINTDIVASGKPYSYANDANMITVFDNCNIELQGADNGYSCICVAGQKITFTNCDVRSTGAKMDCPLYFANASIGEIILDGGYFDSSKNHLVYGFGTKSIKKAVSKYGEDNIFFETENGVFALSFSLEFEEVQ